MPKDKEPKKISPYEEMESARREVEETLPIEQDAYEDSIPEGKPKQNQRDYLEDYTPQQNNNRNFSQPLMFNEEGKDNLIADLLKVDWIRIEHIIRGHKPKIDLKSGEEYFVKIDDHYLNENGVNSILHFLSFYLSKDIKLGRYSEEQVEIIMKNFARQFTDFFYDNIEEFGLNTPSKKKMSKMFVHSVIDLVDASYSCAIQGRTIELMLKQFSVMQQEPIGEPNFNPNGNQQRKPNFLQRIFG